MFCCTDCRKLGPSFGLRIKHYDRVGFLEEDLEDCRHQRILVASVLCSLPWSDVQVVPRNLVEEESVHTAAALLGTKQSNPLRKRSEKAYHELRVSLNEGIGRAAKSVVGRSYNSYTWSQLCTTRCS